MSGGARASSLSSLGRALMAWLVPPHVRTDAEATRRAELVVATSLGVAGVALIALIVVPWGGWVDTAGLFLPRPAVTLLIAMIPMHLSLAIMVRAAGSVDRPAALVPVALVTMISALAFFGGGYDSAMLWWLTAGPLFSTFLSGPRTNVAMTILCAALLLGFYTADQAGYAWPGAMEALEAGPLRLRSQILLLGFITFVSWSYERSRKVRDGALIAATAKLEASNRALRYSQLHMQQIAENIGQAIWMYDVDTRAVVYANSAFEDVFVIPREALAHNPRRWIGSVHPEDLDLIPTDPVGTDHIYRIDVGGDERWIRHAVYPVTDDDQRVRRTIHIAADITMRKLGDALRERFIDTVIQVQEAERKRLARELHDEASQSLTALLVGLKGLDATPLDDRQRGVVEGLRAQLRHVLGEMGRLARGLHPAMLDELGLITAVGRLVDDAREHGRLRVNLRVAGFAEGEDLTLPASIALTAYRIVQEALGNVVKHAGASEVDVALSLEGDTLRVRVEDDGRGFDPAAVAQQGGLRGGLGLLSMRERAALQGGNVAVESAAGQGTTVLADLPLFPRANTAEIRRVLG